MLVFSPIIRTVYIAATLGGLFVVALSEVKGLPSPNRILRCAQKDNLAEA